MRWLKRSSLPRSSLERSPSLSQSSTGAEQLTRPSISWIGLLPTQSFYLGFSNSRNTVNIVEHSWWCPSISLCSSGTHVGYKVNGPWRVTCQLKSPSRVRDEDERVAGGKVKQHYPLQWGVINLPPRQISDFFTRSKRNRIEIVTGPVIDWTAPPSRRRHLRPRQQFRNRPFNEATTIHCQWVAARVQLSPGSKRQLPASTGVESLTHNMKTAHIKLSEL